ncbi:hydroxypyruvate isomerase family protein [Sediminibacterium soli]|uniref:hydroxypyruvate isomerase family protein n=1 Tax=Sediminibacterium soli TaxID=2698829 RepID=UPI001379D543|nr:TIM barrel protein [Sediminibacterium soli]NCI46829.1 TIM barrel protein [Sediminibacterium soli]
MQRRKFMQQSLLAGGSLLSLSETMAAVKKTHTATAAQPFQCNYAFHDGMFRNHAGNDFIDQIKFGHEMGFRAIEDNGMMSRTPEMQQKIGDTLAKLGMTMGVFVNQFDKWPLQISMTGGKKEWKDKFIQYCKDSVEVAKRCNAKWITVVPGNYDRTLPEAYQTANVIEFMRRGAEILEPHGLVMVMEPLSDTPELFLRLSSQTYTICKAVNSPSCKILFDMYHMQRNEGNIISNIDRAWDEIAYFQIGDNPGRKEPGTGEMNYQNIFKHILKKGYKGVYGMEHGNAKPGKEGEEALINAYRTADSFSV